MARSGIFGTGLSPFGQGALNLDDVYRIESPQPTTTPPTGSPAPDRSPPPSDRGTVPVPKPPVVGKVPQPGAKKPAVQKARPVAKKPVAKAAPRKAVPKKPVAKPASPDLYQRLRYGGQQLPTPPKTTARPGGSKAL